MVERGFGFQFALLDDEPGPAKFRREVQQFAGGFFPVVFDAGQRRFVDGSDQTPIGSGDAQLFTKLAFTPVNAERVVAGDVRAGQRTLQLAGEPKVLLVGLGALLFGARPLFELQPGQVSGRLGAVPGDDRCRDAAVRGVQIPVGDLDVANQVADLDLEVRQLDVFVERREDDRDPVDQSPAVPHQRMEDLSLDQRGVIRRR